MQRSSSATALSQEIGAMVFVNNEILTQIAAFHLETDETFVEVRDLGRQLAFLCNSVRLQIQHFERDFEDLGDTLGRLARRNAELRQLVRNELPRTSLQQYDELRQLVRNELPRTSLQQLDRQSTNAPMMRQALSSDLAQNHHYK